MRAERLLSVASFVCGRAARVRVFEPLVADWQREWHHAIGVLERTRVLARGSVAFAIALLVASDTRDTVSRHARSIGWAALPLFTLIGGTLYLVPLVVWSLSDQTPGTIRSVSDTVLWNIPAVLSFGIVFALLPAYLALAWDRVRMRGLLAAGVLAVVASVAIDGWLVPTVLEQRIRLRFGERAAANGRAAHMTVVDHLRRTIDPDPPVAADARATLLRLSMKMVLMTALGVIGAVVGRSRFVAGKAIGLRTIAGYWLFGWAAAVSLQFFASYLAYYLVLRPYRVTLWLPQLLLLLVGVTGWLALRRTHASRETAHVR